MTMWKNSFNIREIIDNIDDEEDDDIKRGLNEIAIILEKENCFKNFAYIEQFKNPQEAFGIFNMQDIANKLLEKLYDYADDNKIWLGI